MKTVGLLAIGTTECPFCTRFLDIAFNISPLTQKLLIHRQGVGLCAGYDEDLGITAENNLFAQRIIGSSKIVTLA